MGRDMKSVQVAFQNLIYVISLNSDRILYVLTVAAALGFGGFIGSLFWAH